MGEGGGGAHKCIYCTPSASAPHAGGDRSQDLENASALNRTGREPAVTSHRLNRCSGDQLSRGQRLPEARQVVPRPDAQECALATAKMPEL
jgi:hypothetical protein